MLRLLRDNASAAETDMARFMRALAMNFVILGTDAHAKNASVLIAPGQGRPRVRLAPAYDVNSYLPYAGKDTEWVDLAMSVGGHYASGKIMPRHWEREARAGGASPTQAMADLRDIIAKAPDLSSMVARQCHEDGLRHPVLAQLADLIAQRCVQLGRIYGAEPAD